MKLFKQKTIKTIGVIGISSVIFCCSFILVRAEKVKKFKQNGMTFVVGKHEPEKRVYPKPKKGVVEKIVVRERVIEKYGSSADENESSQEEKDFQNNDENIEKKVNKNGEDNWRDIFQGLLNDLKEKVEDILNRLGVVEKKIDSIDNLVETTTVLTNEMVEQNKKIENLEDKILKEGDEGDK